MKRKSLNEKIKKYKPNLEEKTERVCLDGTSLGKVNMDFISNFYQSEIGDIVKIPQIRPTMKDESKFDMKTSTKDETSSTDITLETVKDVSIIKSSEIVLNETKKKFKTLYDEDLSPVMLNAAIENMIDDLATKAEMVFNNPNVDISLFPQATEDLGNIAIESQILQEAHEITQQEKGDSCDSLKTATIDAISKHQEADDI